MKSVAFLLMLIHHLWREPGFARFEPVEYGNILLSIGLMSKISVGIFMFLSGYGLMTSVVGEVKYSIQKRLQKSLPPFWFIVLLSAPYLLINGIIGWQDVVTDGLLLTSKMNGSWWFMQTYIIFLICFPLFVRSLKNEKVCILIFTVSILCFQSLAIEVREYSEAVHYMLHYFPLFYAGMLARKLSLFDKLAYKPMWMKILLFLIIIASRFLTGWHILNIGLIVVMIMVFIDIQSLIPDKIKQLFSFFGLMSMNMWLVHMFFIEYGSHLMNPIFDVFWIYAESLVAAYFLFVVYKRLQKLVL